MRSIRDALAGIVFISTLVAVANWYASDPEMPHWTRSFSDASVTAVTSLPPISVDLVDWSADGRTLLSLSRGHAGGREKLVLHDAVQRTGLMPIDLTDETIAAAVLAPDGRHAVVGTFRGKLWWIDLESLETIALVELPDAIAVTAAAVSADGRLIAAATGTGRIYVRDVIRRVFVEIAGDRQFTTRLCFSNDGTRLISAGTDGSLDLWDLVSGQRLQTFAERGQPVTGAGFLACGKRIISAGLDDSIRIWDIATGSEEWRGEFGLMGVNSLAVSADGKLAAWGGFGHRIIVWDVDRRCKKFDIVTPASSVHHLKFTADGTLLAAAGREGMIRIYDSHSGIEQNGIDLGIVQGL